MRDSARLTVIHNKTTNFDMSLKTLFIPVTFVLYKRIFIILQEPSLVLVHQSSAIVVFTPSLLQSLVIGPFKIYLTFLN